MRRRNQPLRCMRKQRDAVHRFPCLFFDLVRRLQLIVFIFIQESFPGFFDLFTFGCRCDTTDD